MTERGRFYIRARVYEPSAGRWMSQDPIGAAPNLYAYCGNNPVIFVDPSGEVLVYIDVSGKHKDGDAFVESDVIIEGVLGESKIFEDSRKKAKEVANEVAALDDAAFDTLAANGNVKFDGKPFTGRRDEYVEKVRREGQSAMYTQQNGDLDALVEKPKTAVSKNEQAHDVTALAVHGAPQGNINIAGNWYPATSTLPKLDDLAKDIPGTYVRATCFTNEKKEEEYIS